MSEKKTRSLTSEEAKTANALVKAFGERARLGSVVEQQLLLQRLADDQSLPVEIRTVFARHATLKQKEADTITEFLHEEHATPKSVSNMVAPPEKYREDEIKRVKSAIDGLRELTRFGCIPELDSWSQGRIAEERFKFVKRESAIINNIVADDAVPQDLREALWRYMFIREQNERATITKSAESFGLQTKLGKRTATFFEIASREAEIKNLEQATEDYHTTKEFRAQVHDRLALLRKEVDALRELPEEKTRAELLLEFVDPKTTQERREIINGLLLVMQSQVQFMPFGGPEEETYHPDTKSKSAKEGPPMYG